MLKHLEPVDSRDVETEMTLPDRYISLSKKSSLFDGGNFWQARPYCSKTRKFQVECTVHYNILNSSRYKVDRFSKQKYRMVNLIWTSDKQWMFSMKTSIEYLGSIDSNNSLSTRDLHVTGLPICVPV